MDSGGVSPGWYPDPWQQAPFRWWDGKNVAGLLASRLIGEVVDAHISRVAG